MYDVESEAICKCVEVCGVLSVFVLTRFPLYKFNWYLELYLYI